MDSPVFGNVQHQPNLIFRKQFVQSNHQHKANATTFEQLQNIYCIMVLESNIKKLTNLIQSKIILRNKRVSFNNIYDYKCINHGLVELKSYIIVEKKLKQIVSIVNKLQKLRLIQGWMKIYIYSTIVDNDNVEYQQKKFFNDVEKTSKGKRLFTNNFEDLKQNSLLNVSQIVQQNRMLKSQIISQQTECENFMEKMIILLDTHQKIKSKTKKK